MPKRIGVAIDEQLWEEFREDVKRRKGRTSGVLADELETAIRQHIYTGNDATQEEQLDTMAKRLQRIENKLGTVESDGGVGTEYGEPHTHAPESRERVTEKPAANAPTDEKVAYLKACVVDQKGTDGVLLEVPRSGIADVVKTEYGFRRDTARRYVKQLVDALDLRDHPSADGILVSEAREEELLEKQREQAREDINEDVYESE